VEVLGSTFEWVWWQLLQALEVLCLSIIGLTIAVGNIVAALKMSINAKMSEAIRRRLSVKKRVERSEFS